MPRRSFGKMICRHFVVVGTLVAMSSMLACSDDDTTTTTNTPTKKDVNDVSIPLDTTTAGENSTAILNDLSFDVPSTVLTKNATPAALATALASNTKTSIKFTNVSGADGDFAMTSPTLSGKLKIASCTFTVSLPANLAGSIFIKTCAIKVTATGVSQGGAGTPGSAVLSLDGVSSDPVTVTVGLGSDGSIVVNNHPTKAKVTGTSGS